MISELREIIGTLVLKPGRRIRSSSGCLDGIGSFSAHRKHVAAFAGTAPAAPPVPKNIPLNILGTLPDPDELVSP